MNIAYDPEHRSLYVKLHIGDSVESLEVAPGIVLDLDTDGVVLGIDIDDVERRTALPVDTERSA